MAAFNGKYEFVRNEGQLEHLVAIGVPEDRAKSFLDKGKSLEISVNGNNISIVRDHGQNQNLTLNEETSETGFDGKTFTNLPTLDGNQLTIVSKGTTGEWTRIFSLNGSELTVTSTSSKPGVKDGRRIYKKL